MTRRQRPQGKIHSVPKEQDAEMAGALGQYVNAICGYRWIPDKFGDECEGLTHCVECFPPAKEKKPRKPRFGPRDTDPIPNYVYRCYDAAGRLIYVGCTNNPVLRLASHKKAWWGDQLHTTRLIVFPNRRHALNRETDAIRTEKPRWNVKGKWASRSDDWTVEDYVDFRTAVHKAANGIYGPSTNRTLANIDAELTERFAVTAITGRQA